MEKKLCVVFLILAMTLYSLTIPAMAAGTLTLSASSAAPGDVVTVSGISAADTWVAVKVLDGSGNIVFYDNVTSDMIGAYTCTFKVPAVYYGNLKVVVGYGGDVAVASLNVAEVSNNGDHDNNNSGSSGSAEIPKTETTTANNTATATTTVTTTVDNSGKETAEVTWAQVSDAISKAVEEAVKQGNGMTATVRIKVEGAMDAKMVEVSLPKTAVDTVAGSNIVTLTVSTPIAAITFDAEALETISGEAAATDVKISVTKVDVEMLSDEIKQVVGDRPVYDFSVTSGSKVISEFGGNVSVSVPYTPKAGEDTNAIVIYSINSDGKPEAVTDCSYDPETGRITFVTNHFSMYAVGYNKVVFHDVASTAWYADAVSFVAAREITAGTGNGKYSPEGKLTRGQFLTMIMRAYGMKPDENSKDNFSDAGSTYYTGYLAAAKRLGLSGGIGDNLFAPEKEITRQEMFTLLYNTLKQIDELPAVSTGKNLNEHSDANDIAAWAKDAMTLFAKTGTLSGSNGKLAPAGTADRAQMAQVLYNLLSE